MITISNPFDRDIKQIQLNKLIKEIFDNDLLLSYSINYYPHFTLCSFNLHCMNDENDNDTLFMLD